MDVVVKYKGSQLSESDVDILSTPSYLNDEIIGFYFNYLASITEADDVVFIPPAVSELLVGTEDVDVVKSSVEPLGLGAKNLIFFAVNDCSHWSLLVYERKLNEFLHHDSMEGANNIQAMKLYDVLKEYVVASGKESVKGKKVSKSKKGLVGSKPVVISAPGFKECATPQQTNGYDCGLFVLAIARAICEWHCSNKKLKVGYWFEEKEVNPSVVENSMRSEVLSLINELSLGD